MDPVQLAIERPRCLVTLQFAVPIDATDTELVQAAITNALLALPAIRRGTG